MFTESREHQTLVSNEGPRKSKDVMKCPPNQLPALSAIRLRKRYACLRIFNAKPNDGSTYSSMYYSLVLQVE